MAPIEALGARYAQANGLAKSVSLASREAVIPAHNELRNAGYHLLHAIDGSGCAVDDEQIDKAIAHCDRAIYDAAEAGVIITLDALSHWFP